MRKRKVKASSLLETLVALVILLTVFSIGLVSIHHVIGSSKVGAKTKVSFQLEELLAESVRDRKYFDEEMEIPPFRIVKEVYASPLSDSLLVIAFSAVTDKGYTVAMVKQTVVKDD